MPFLRVDLAASFTTAGVALALGASCAGQSSSKNYVLGGGSGGEVEGGGRANAGTANTAGETHGGRAAGGRTARAGAANVGGRAPTGAAGDDAEPDPDIGGEGGRAEPAGLGGEGGSSGEAADACASTCTTSFQSDTTWLVYDREPGDVEANLLGDAQPVCLNLSSPPSCPAGAVMYDYVGTAWTTDLTSVPGASWIWGPGVTSATPADLQTFFFAHDFTLGKEPSGTISIYADDYALVEVNGTPIGEIGSITQMIVSSGELTTFDLTSALVAGRNRVTVVGKNGPAWFAGSSTPCAYDCNPGGVVFGGTFSSH